MWWEDPDFASKSTGMSGFVNFTDNLPLGCPYGKFCQQRLRVWIFPDFYYSPRIFAAWQLHAWPWIFGDLCIHPDFLFHRGGVLILTWTRFFFHRGVLILTWATLRDVCGWRGIYKKVWWMFCMKESICLQPSRRGGIDGGAKWI